MIVYLHGFASTGVSDKVDSLRSRYGDQVVSPDLPFDPDEVCVLVKDIVYNYFRNRKDNEKLIFVGTSLGAFYANYFGHFYDCPVVLVNPSVYPNESLKSKLGVNRNYVTKEEFFVSLAHLETLESMRHYVNENYSGYLVNLFLAKDDDVIPYDIALQAYTYPASLTVTDDGGHRYNKHWDLVLHRVGELLNSYTL